MKTFLLITAVILWVALRTHAANAKRKASQEDAASEPSQPSYNSVRSAFESLFDEDEKAEPAHQSFAQEEEKAGYYSYETVDEPEAAPVYAKVDPTMKRKAWTPDAEAEDESSLPDFDLRQAIIYQTVLSNKYLDEMHSTEN